ncbi:MAG: Methylamine utilization protein MauE [Syntrophorhabdus sp. PtaU1.Bin002]|nr:MAG: Methylamine utilization protein MauE [Syntrophorhabdus sp. PtaU1.Bin002]
MERRTILQIKGFFRGMLLSRWPYLFVRIVLAAIFIYAGSLKLVDPKAFARIISHYGLLPEPLLPVVAIGLPIAEVFAGVALIFNLRPGLYGVSVLVLLFVVVLGYGVLTEMDIDCGCFGPEELAGRRGLARAFYRDLALLGAVVFLHWSRLVRDRRLLEVSTQTLPK